MRGRQITGPRRVVLLVPWESSASEGIQLLADSAVDTKATKVKDYWDALFDESKLVMLPGERPTWFTIAPLTSGQKLAAPSSPIQERVAWFIRCGLVRIENYQVRGVDGVDKEAEQPDRADRGGRVGEMASEEWYLRCQITDEDKLALYRMINHVSEAQHPLSKGSARPAGESGSSTEQTANAG
jgi:hypothetical protein